MRRSKELEVEKTPAHEENRETLEAIDAGIRDAESGRTVPMDQVRKLLPKWITAFSTRKGRSTT